MIDNMPPDISALSAESVEWGFELFSVDFTKIIDHNSLDIRFFDPLEQEWDVFGPECTDVAEGTGVSKCSFYTLPEGKPVGRNEINFGFSDLQGNSVERVMPHCDDNAAPQLVGNDFSYFRSNGIPYWPYVSPESPRYVDLVSTVEEADRFTGVIELKDDGVLVATQMVQSDFSGGGLYGARFDLNALLAGGRIGHREITWEWHLTDRCGNASVHEVRKPFGRGFSWDAIIPDVGYADVQIERTGENTALVRITLAGLWQHGEPLGGVVMQAFAQSESGIVYADEVEIPAGLTRDNPGTLAIEIPLTVTGAAETVTVSWGILDYWRYMESNHREVALPAYETEPGLNWIGELTWQQESQFGADVNAYRAGVNAIRARGNFHSWGAPGVYPLNRDAFLLSGSTYTLDGPLYPFAQSSWAGSTIRVYQAAGSLSGFGAPFLYLVTESGYLYDFAQGVWMDRPCETPGVNSCVFPPGTVVSNIPSGSTDAGGINLVLPASAPGSPYQTNGNGVRLFVLGYVGHENPIVVQGPGSVVEIIRMD